MTPRASSISPDRGGTGRFGRLKAPSLPRGSVRSASLAPRKPDGTEAVPPPDAPVGPRLYLIRHTSVDVPDGLCYGRTEVPLAATFSAEASAVRAILPPGPWRVFSSPASRCRRLAAFLDQRVEIDERLHELDFGEWENRFWPDLPRAATEHWLADFVNRRPPGGESFAELAARAAAFADDIATHCAEQRVVAVAHAGVIRALLAHAQGRPLAEAFSIPVPTGSVHPATLPGIHSESPIHDLDRSYS